MIESDQAEPIPPSIMDESGTARYSPLTPCGVASASLSQTLAAGIRATRKTHGPTIPAGKALFFPIINAEWDTAPDVVNPLNRPDPLSIQGVRDITAFLISGATLSAGIGGVPVENLQNYRVQSPPE